jgi:osmotically inducible protein OsmC
MKTILYRTPTIISIGGRDGSIRSADGLIDLQLAVPKEMGGQGGKTNPRSFSLRVMPHVSIMR